MELTADQNGSYDPAQIIDPAYYPTGYHWKFDPVIGSKNVIAASVVADQSHPGFAALTISFDSPGTNEFSKITLAAAQAPPSAPQNRIAVFVDNTVISAPAVISPSRSQTVITGNFSAQQADDLVCGILTGSR